MDLLPIFLEWCILPATFAAVWLPLAFSITAIVYRYRQGFPFAWWIGCLGIGTFLGASLTNWVPGSGLYILPGFFVAHLLWLLFLANVPQRLPELLRATPTEIQRFYRATDPFMIAAGVFLSTFAVDILHALLLGMAGVTGWGKAWFYGIGGAGFEDGLFGSTAISFVLFYATQRFVMIARQRRGL